MLNECQRLPSTAITWVLVFRLFESCCGVKEDPPSAVGGLGRFSVCGAGLEDFLKAHGLRSMGLGAAGLKKTHPAQWVGLED